jgi:hypothetical protein
MISEQTFTLAISVCVEINAILKRNESHPESKKRQRALSLNIQDAIARVVADVEKP